MIFESIYLKKKYEEEEYLAYQAQKEFGHNEDYFDFLGKQQREKEKEMAINLGLFKQLYK